MIRYQEKPDFSGTVSIGEQCIRIVDIALAFGHLLSLHKQMLAVQPEARHSVRSHGLENGARIVVMADQVVDPSTVDGEGLMEIAVHHARVLNVPRGPAFSYRCLPIVPFACLASVPENKIAEIPAHARVGVFTEAPFRLRPPRHIKAVNFSETFKFQRLKIYITLVPVC